MSNIHSLFVVCLLVTLLVLANSASATSCPLYCLRNMLRTKGTTQQMKNCYYLCKAKKDAINMLMLDYVLSDLELCPDFQVVQSKQVRGTFTSRKDCGRMAQLAMNGQASVFYPERINKCKEHFSSPGCFLAGRAN